jgi:hypothetical protein
MRVLSSLSLKNNKLATKEGGKALAHALANNSALKELDVSSNNWMQYGTHGRWMGDGPGFAEELVAGIKDSGVISSVNVLGNGLGKEGAEVLRSACENHSTLKTICGALDQLDLSGRLGDDLPVVLVELEYNGALLVLSFKENNLCAAGAKALGEGPKGNQTITELDLAGNKMGKVSAKWDAKDDMSGVITLAEAIANMVALSSANLLMNLIDIEQAQALATILKEHPALKSLCGNKGDETELDMSGRMNGAGAAILLASEIIDNGALRCTNGTPYQPEKLFMMSTHVCRHCRQHKIQHTSRSVRTLSPHDWAHTAPHAPTSPLSIPGASRFPQDPL